MRTARIFLLIVSTIVSHLYAVDCSFQSVVSPIVRSNGLTEGIGDLYVLCTDLPSTPIAVNLSVVLPAPVTSRAFAGTTPQSTEAVVLVNEPGAPLFGAPATQVVCTAPDVLANTCANTANVFPGFLNSAPNVIDFFNVPIPSSGLNVPYPLVVLHVTNIRVNAAALGTSGQGSITAALSMTGPASVHLQAPATAVAAVYQPGLAPSQILLPDLSGPVPAGGLALSQCVAVNKPLALDPASTSAPDGTSFVLRIPETFAASFKTQTFVYSSPADVNTRPLPAVQNIPGTMYNSETMFYNPSLPGTLGGAGLATQATRILVRFTGPPSGVQVHAPVYERGKGLMDSRVRLVSAAPDGSWPTYEPLGPLSALNTFYSGSQVYVYEVTAKAPPPPYSIDTIDLPFYLAHTGMPYVTPGATTVSITLAPISTDMTPFGTYIPRFVDTSAPAPVANLTACAGAPALKALISSRSGPSAGRTWQVGINNYGTAAATNARITSLVLTQTFGPACTPVVNTAFPVFAGTVVQSSTVNVPVTLNFGSCTSTSRFKVDIGFAADGVTTGTSTYSNQFQ